MDVIGREKKGGEKRDKKELFDGTDCTGTKKHAKLEKRLSPHTAHLLKGPDYATRNVETPADPLTRSKSR